MVQHLAFSVSHHKAVSSGLSRGTNEFLDKSKQNQPEWGGRSQASFATKGQGGFTNVKLTWLGLLSKYVDQEEVEVKKTKNMFI